MAIYGTLGEVNVGALSAITTDNAVDVFVYDTRKDSDGGQWRKRTQHTSWYNETLNTATRGSRKEFPAVAVIVAETAKVTIYDGDDPDLPMWMVFLSGGSYNWSGTTRDLTSIYMLNGILVCGYGGSGAGAREITFTSDIIRVLYTSDFKPNGGIKTRNDSVSWGSGETRLIVNNIINDVAMTVLPSAPIDDATGLPIPTIAVATDAGVSVIKDDGTVVDILSDSGSSYDNSQFISFNSNHQLVFDFDNAKRIIRTLDIPTSDYTILQWNVFNDTGATIVGNSWIGSSNALAAPNIDRFQGLTTLPNGGVARSDTGILIWDENKNNPDRESLGCYISSSYNTGWMHGDIKGAFLSDTDATNVTGTELITNGTFDSDTTGWSAFRSATLSVSSGALRVTNTSLITSGAHYQIFTEIGKEYVFSFDVLNTSAFNAYVGVTDSNTYNGGTFVYGSGSGYAILPSGASYSGTFIAADSVYYIHLHIYGGTLNGGFLEFDNVSVRLSESDRSVNNKGLQVFGTITKSAVATGAELVAYSGWSTSNYLEQPYNSDFDLTSTQDASWIIWFKNTESIETYYHFFDSGYVLDSAQHYWLIGILGTGDGRPTFRLNGATQQNLNGVGNYLDGLWHQVILTRSGGGNLISMYIDGKLSSTLSSSPLEITHSSTAKLRIGLRGGTDSRQNTGGYLTQLRFSKSAPSSEQIKKIYEDEKVLFQENAACTLYGSSDAITALAYDDTTSLLHVGTSSGRSEFKGLRRVGNTTTAVTTAISASNGLVAEQ